jgi:hypothetical protein
MGISKPNKYIKFFKSNETFTAEVKYRITEETADYYVAKKQKIDKTEEYNKYETGEIKSKQ